MTNTKHVKAKHANKKQEKLKATYDNALRDLK